MLTRKHQTWDKCISPNFFQSRMIFLIVSSFNPEATVPFDNCFEYQTSDSFGLRCFSFLNSTRIFLFRFCVSSLRFSRLMLKADFGLSDCSLRDSVSAACACAMGAGL